MTNHLKVGDRKFDGFCVINHANPDCGFFALVSTALNSVRVALQHNWLPVIRFDRNVSDYFYDEARGDEIWSYYFEPVMGLSYKAFKKLVDAGEIDASLVHTYNDRNKVDQHLGCDDPDFITHFWGHYRPVDPAEWMTRKRLLGREYVAKYVRVKPHIQSLVDQFYCRHMDGFLMFGVHIRGTDFGYAEPTRPETYFQAIREKMVETPGDKTRIFLATDQQQFVEQFEREFGSLVMTYDAMRSESEVAPFQFKKASPYKKGEDVLVDVLLMSKCNFLFKGASAVGEYALWFNPDLECRDFGLDSERDLNHRAPAALKLNVNDRHPVVLKAALAYKTIKRSFLDFGISAGRRVLPVAVRDWLWLRIGRHMYFFK